MTTLERDTAHRGDDKAAAWTFGAFLFLALGPLGAVLAAAAVGTERAFANAGWGRPGAGAATPEQRRAQREAHAREARDWLVADRERRRERRRELGAYRDRHDRWVQSGRQGQAPAAPKGLTWREKLIIAREKSKAWYRLLDRKLTDNDTIPDAAARAWQFAVGAVDGARDGYAAARQAQREGQSPWQSRKARPPAPESEPDPGQTDNAQTDNAQPDSPADPPDEPQGDPVTDLKTATPTGAAGPSTTDAARAGAVPGWNGETAAGAQAAVNRGSSVNEFGSEIKPGATSGGGVAAGTAPARGGTPQGETNTDLIMSDLATAQRLLIEIDEANNEQAARGTQLSAVTQRLAERAERFGAPVAVTQAVVDGQATVSVLSTSVGDIAERAGDAQDQLTVARTSMAPAVNAQDQLQTAGARGDVVATATQD